ncbi:ABC transporter permease [Pontibacter russatus]|uniref:ABC transporter permease n=1 Tax=Pontibacter russatus TaxID=2694929 RepID=UPI00137AB4FD|nr:ABC transporter permease [Pontibacter russatus]
MNRAWRDIKGLWKEYFFFRVAATYLGLLLLLVLVLPLLPLPYGPNDLDLTHIYQPPFGNSGAADSHFLGTDGLGRDVLVNMLYGARTAFYISIPVMALAMLIGLALGTGAGFYGDTGFRTSRKNLLLCLLGLPFVGYYWLYLPAQGVRLKFSTPTYIGSFVLGAVGLVLLSAVLRLLHRYIASLRYQVAVPVDQLVLRLTEAMATIPHFVLILVLASLMPPSVLALCFIISLTAWTGIARLARAEMMRVRHLPYFEAARSIGLNTRQLIWRQALPNLLGPVLVAFTFGLGGLLALESTLSFLNIGVPATLVSWGRMIAEIRSNMAAWWLLVFPGGLLTLTILALYTCSHYLSKIFHEKSRH